MSGNEIAAENTFVRQSAFHAVLRYAAGSALIMMVATGWDYTLAYLTPILALNFLAPGTKTPTLRTGLLFLVSVAISCMAALLFSTLFLNFPLVFLPLLALILFHIYYTEYLQPMKLWLIIAFLVIPMMMMKTPALGSIVAVNLFMNALVALVLSWLVWMMFPDSDADAVPEKKSIPGSRYSSLRFTDAMTRILVVLPMLVLFFVFNLSDSLLVLVFIAVLSMNPATANRKAGVALIVANLGGGLAAIIVYQMLTVVPSFLFSGLITLLAGLLFAVGVFGGKPAGALFGMAYSTFLLIQGNVVALAGEAGEKVWVRMLQIGVAVGYMVAGFMVADGLSKKTV